MGPAALKVGMGQVKSSDDLLEDENDEEKKNTIQVVFEKIFIPPPENI